MTTLAARLETLGAYRDLVAWAEPFGDEIARAFEACPRGDWVIAIGVALEAPRQQIVRAACDCAGLAVELLDETTARDAIAAVEAARAWADSGTRPEKAIAAACETLADHPDPLVQSAAIAALSCLLAIDAPREAPASAAAATSAAALHAAECGAHAAMSYVARRSAELARAAISLPSSSP